MNPESIIREAQADGLSLALTSSGTIKATGEDEAINRWLPEIREHKAEIIQALQKPEPGIQQLSDEDEALILAWLKRIGETDVVTIDKVINKCRCGLDVRSYFVRRATEIGTSPNAQANSSSLITNS